VIRNARLWRACDAFTPDPLATAEHWQRPSRTASEPTRIDWMINVSRRTPQHPVRFESRCRRKEQCTSEHGAQPICNRWGALASEPVSRLPLPAIHGHAGTSASGVLPSSTRCLSIRPSPARCTGAQDPGHRAAAHGHASRLSGRCGVFANAREARWKPSALAMRSHGAPPTR